jgi:hypothetical protein
MVRPIVVPNPKITMDMNSGPNGWSESHFWNSAVPLNNATLVAAALTLCKARCKALDGVNAYLFAARISLDDVNRDSNPVDIDSIVRDPIHGYAALGGPDPSNTASWAYQTPQVSWQVNLETNSPTCNTTLYMAGMPASVTQSGPMPTQDTPPTVASYLASYLSPLVTGGWGALGRDWSDPTYQLTGITFTPAAGATPSQLNFAFALPYPTPSAFPVGDYYRMQGTVYTSPQKRLRLNGTYTVAAYNPTTGILTANVPRVLVAPVFTGYGTLQAAEGAVFQYTTWNYRPITHRKRGRAFGGGRGRR